MMHTPPDAYSLICEVRRVFPEWRVQDVVPVAVGLEAAVFRADTGAHGAIALKVPHTRHVDNDNDRGLDARDILRQDALAFVHIRNHGLPAPSVVALHYGDAIDFLAYDFVEVDGTECSPEGIGRLLRRLHDIERPDFIPVAHRQQSNGENVLATLTHERIAVVRRHSAGTLPPLSLNALRSAFASDGGPRALLHMDVRSPNLLCRGGSVVGLIDWSNALVANPLLELARIAEYGWPIELVLRGYGRDICAIADQRSVLAARLYTAAMLAVVFLSETPDAIEGPAAAERVRVLLEEMATSS